MLPFQIGRIIFEVAQLREAVPSCQLRASLYCEQQSSHANAGKSAAHMGGANGVLALLRHRGYRIEQL